MLERFWFVGKSDNLQDGYMNMFWIYKQSTAAHSRVSSAGSGRAFDNRQAQLGCVTLYMMHEKMSGKKSTSAEALLQNAVEEHKQFYEPSFLQ